MNFEWDEEKSESNKRKHGIDFEAAKSLWLDENRLEIHAPYPLEERNIIIAEVENKLWTENQDRGRSRDLRPPTPPCVRVRTRRFT